MHSPVHQGLILLSRLLLLLAAVLAPVLLQTVLLGRVGLVAVAVQMVLAVQEIHRLQAHHKETTVAAQMFHQLIIMVVVAAVLVGLVEMLLPKLAAPAVMV
jgi:hypothetical protein